MKNMLADRTLTFCHSLVTLCCAGGDSGIGRSVAVHFAREGADVAIVYLDEHKDADETVALAEKEGRKCLKFAGDVGKPEVRVLHLQH
jgi:NAD(P)-dependent dehydrogenase (short-subunit alcohol dehydrogenase family)